jgi:hypothetical protein
MATCIAALALALPLASTAADWPRYGGDDLVTNNVPAERARGLSSSTVQDIVERWSVQVGGRFVASPLYAEGVETAGGVAPIAFADGLVLVADTSGMLHAFGLPRPTRGPGGHGLIAL